jgi:hypothetical protein
VDAGGVDCIVVYKVDRLSRSLLDFARIMEMLDRSGASFVSVTQHFNTTHSMGRLTLNILLSFAQFEREIIAERTRDKMSAARKKGKWVGGQPALGYDVAPQGGRLLVNEDEAARVRGIFELYLEHQSLIATVQELARRGWTNKRWTTREGCVRGGGRGRSQRVNVAATGANVARRGVASTPVHRYFQAHASGGGHAKESATGFLFVRGAKTRPGGPRAIGGGRLGRTFARRIPVAPGANAGGGGPAVAQKKAVAGRGDIRPLPKSCGTVPHDTALRDSDRCKVRSQEKKANVKGEGVQVRRQPDGDAGGVELRPSAAGTQGPGGHGLGPLAPRVLPGGTGRERTGARRVGKEDDKARRLWWNAIEETTINTGFGPDGWAVATPRDRLSV